MSSEGNTAQSFLCVSLCGGLIKANIIAKVPQYNKVWYATPAQQGRLWKIHEMMTTSREKLWHLNPEVSSHKTTKCHLCLQNGARSANNVALAWEEMSMHGACVISTLLCCMTTVGHKYKWELLKSYEKDSCYYERERHNNLTASGDSVWPRSEDKHSLI